MNPFAPALGIADAILYEGYVLYPYTASALKNQVRWQFGVIAPAAYASRGTGEATEAQTEVLLECGDDARIDVLVRFLQIEEHVRNGEPAFDGAVERRVPVTLRACDGTRAETVIAVPFEERVEGPDIYRRRPLLGTVVAEVAAVSESPRLLRLCVRVENHSEAIEGARSSAPRTAFVSAHTLLHVENGAFLSVLDVPSYARSVELRNRNTWPVLVGNSEEDAQRAALVLSSPIILYDFPSVASQSEADTFDGLEIDELMMLSVRSLSDAERAEAKATDPRSHAVIERAERFDAQELARLHGTLTVDGITISQGSCVRLHPKRRADAWDIFLEGKTATVRAVHQDVDERTYVAVTVDDDPASDLHEWYGRSFFFYPDEVEPIGETVRGSV